jgi:hypothetical protein
VTLDQFLANSTDFVHDGVSHERSGLRTVCPQRAWGIDFGETTRGGAQLQVSTYVPIRGSLAVDPRIPHGDNDFGQEPAQGMIQMTTISILPVPAEEGGTAYCALAGDRHGAGKTPGEALDAILDKEESATLVLVRRSQPDQFFTAEQQQRIAELLARWRATRDEGSTLAPAEQAELAGLVEAELRAAGQRAALLADELQR